MFKVFPVLLSEKNINEKRVPMYVLVFREHVSKKSKKSTARRILFDWRFAESLTRNRVNAAFHCRAAYRYIIIPWQCDGIRVRFGRGLVRRVRSASSSSWRPVKCGGRVGVTSFSSLYTAYRNITTKYKDAGTSGTRVAVAMRKRRLVRCRFSGRNVAETA